jgi:hypothetical protein
MKLLLPEHLILQFPVMQPLTQLGSGYGNHIPSMNLISYLSMRDLIPKLYKQGKEQNTSQVCFIPTILQSKENN